MALNDFNSNFDNIPATFGGQRKGFPVDSIDNNGKSNKVMNEHQGDVSLKNILPIYRSISPSGTLSRDYSCLGTLPNSSSFI